MGGATVTPGRGVEGPPPRALLPQVAVLVAAEVLLPAGVGAGHAAQRADAVDVVRQPQAPERGGRWSSVSRGGGYRPPKMRRKTAEKKPAN